MPPTLSRLQRYAIEHPAKLANQVHDQGMGHFQHVTGDPFNAVLGLTVNR
jgi:hypothetical protein